MSTQRNIPGTGFVSLSDYLGANQGTLDRELQGIQGQGQRLTDAGDEQGAHELGRGVGSESGLAGYFGRGAAGSFDSSLLWGAHGGALKSLGDYLGNYQAPTPAPSTPAAEPPVQDNPTPFEVNDPNDDGRFRHY